MKTLLQVLNKAYDKQLLDHKAFRKEWEQKKQVLQQFQIACDKTSDVDIFQYEMIYYSIKMKQRFEDTFFDTYVHMFDYWYDLTYLERKQQMNTDIERLMETLPFFMEGDQKIFFPCFTIAYNHLYTDEIVLLDLKQYRAFIRDFAHEVHTGLYGVRPYQNACCSAQVCVEDGDAFVLYHPITHRLYRHKDGCFHATCSLNPKISIEDNDLLRDLARAFLHDDQDEMLTYMLQGVGVSSKMMHKLEKLQKKIKKKRSKEDGD